MKTELLDSAKQIATRFLVAQSRPRHIECLAGGFSDSAVFQIVDHDDRLWCLKCWGVGRFSIEHLAWIHEALLRSSLEMVPKPLRTEQNESVLVFNEGLWEMLSWQPGAADFAKQPTQARIESVVDAIVALHRDLACVDGERFGPSIAISRRAELCRALCEKLAGAARVLGRVEREDTANDSNLIIDSIFETPSRLPARELHHLVWLAIDRLKESLLVESLDWSSRNYDLQRIHGDLWHDNILFCGDAVTGLIDFGEMRLDVVEFDWARAMGSLDSSSLATWDIAWNRLALTPPSHVVNRRLVEWLNRTTLIGSWLNWVDWLYLRPRFVRDRSSAMVRHRSIAEQILRLS